LKYTELSKQQNENPSCKKWESISEGALQSKTFWSLQVASQDLVQL